jgi:dTDP-4-dehydrorhamnose 3,5-epimerase-like enzyme
MSEPFIIKGGLFADERGVLKFANDLKFDKIKRFYTIAHNDCVTVRAWQGHKIEQKYFFVVQGVFEFAWVKIDDWTNPSPLLKSENCIISAQEPKALFIPAGYANGFKALENNSTVIVFSSLELEESLKDNTRFDKNLWFNWD